MIYLIKKLLEYRRYKEDMNSLFEILYANSEGVNIAKYHLEMNTHKAQKVAKWIMTLMENQK